MCVLVHSTEAASLLRLRFLGWTLLLQVAGAIVQLSAAKTASPVKPAVSKGASATNATTAAASLSTTSDQSSLMFTDSCYNEQADFAVPDDWTKIGVPKTGTWSFTLYAGAYLCYVSVGVKSE